MTDRDRNLARARHVLTQIWLLALQTAHGWRPIDEVVLNGLAQLAAGDLRQHRARIARLEAALVAETARHSR